MRVDSKKFFIALLLFFAVIGGVGIQEYQNVKSSHIQKIRDTLLDAATTSTIITNNNFLERLVINQIAPVEYATNVENLNNLATIHHMRQIYTVILDSNNTLRYGIGNIHTSSQGVAMQPLEPIVENKDKLLSLLKTHQPTFEFDNSEGEHVLYAPNTTSAGIRYLTVAISEPISLQKLSQATFFDTMAKSLLIFLGILPFLILYRNMLSATAVRLSEEVESTNEKLHETTTILEERVEEKTKELVKEGFLDPLTHLHNRYRLCYDMDRNHYKALIIIHLNNLQELNHFFGPSITDSLRQQFAVFLAKHNPNAYRLGRDEFALLVEHSSKIEDIDNFIESLFLAIDEYHFNVHNEEITLKMRMGVDTNDILSLSHADEALFMANEQSLPYCIYEEEHELALHQEKHLTIASSIREAYYDGRIICYYQPIVSTQTGDMLGYETLARLIDKNATILCPDDFLSIAKKTALYPEISREIIRQTCEAFEKRNDLFSIHLCALDLIDNHTLRYLQEALVTTNTSNRIIFEICEKDINEYFEIVSSFIERMKPLGVKISIDNFGSGYSNLMQLLQLKIDYIKIDGSLIGNLKNDPKYIKAIESIQIFAETLGAVIIAENVEDDETFILLQSSKVHYVQGFYIGNPGHLL